MLPNLPSSHRILIAILNWGLGHATRCIPIIDQLLIEGKELAIAGDGESLQMLQRRYPNLVSFNLPSYNIVYEGNMVMSMIKQAPKLINTFRKEKKVIKTIIKEWKPDTIISDNRFGVFNNKTLNIYITHQLNILHKNKIIANTANFIHRKIIHNYHHCWIPDNEDQSLSGVLSNHDKIKIPCTYIGGLSRLNITRQPSSYDILILISGPEPARSILETKMLALLKNKSNLTIKMVRGTQKKNTNTLAKHWKIYDIVDQDVLQKLISEAGCIVCRSGYSTIMDLQNFSRPKYYIPTPGQTEQEYLAEYHADKNGGRIFNSLDFIKLK